MVRVTPAVPELSAPPLAVRLTPRFVSDAEVVMSEKTPPSRTILSETAEAGAAPRAPAELNCKVPPETLMA